jgi:hypothetical protein
MGQFTVSDTLNLLLVGTLLGVVGAGIYALLRGLRIGPRWFQVLTIGAGPAVVVGAMIVHTNGVDFRLLEPTWLAIGLFVAIPGIYAALLTLLAERVLHPGGWWERAPFPLARSADLCGPRGDPPAGQSGGRRHGRRSSSHLRVDDVDR